MTGVPVSGVPTARVKCRALLRPTPTDRSQRGRIRRRTPAPAPPLAPTPPGTRGIRTPDSGPHARGSSTSFVNPPLPQPLPSGSPGAARPLPPAASPQQARAAPVPAAAAAARLLPRLCRRRSEPHTHRYTQPSDVTEPSARPRHCGDTQLPADAAAVSGRPGESEGGGEGEEGRGTEPAAAPRARACHRRRRLAASSSSGTRAPSGLLWLLRAPPAPSSCARAPPPRRAPGAPGPARRLGGWRAALSAVHPAQTGCSLPAPPPPSPSLLPSSSRPAGCLGPPPPRPRPTRCSVVTGQTRGRPGRSAAERQGERGQDSRAVHCARPQQPAGRRQGPPGRVPPPEVRHGRPSPRRAAAGPPRPGGSRVAAALRYPPLWALRAGLHPPPPQGLPPADRPASCLRFAPPWRPPPCLGSLRPDAFPRLTSIRLRARPEG